MGQLSRLLLSGLLALSLTVAAAPAQATSWTATISDVMNLVYCLVGSGSCDGLAPASTVDITSNDAEIVAAAMPSCNWGAGEVWDGSSCASADTSVADHSPNYFLLGMCGPESADLWGDEGPYDGYVDLSGPLAGDAHMVVLMLSITLMSQGAQFWNNMLGLGSDVDDPEALALVLCQSD